MRFKDISIKMKILTIAIAGIIMTASIIAVIYIVSIEDRAVDAILEKSRAVVFTAEATREAMADRIESGVIRDLEELATTGNNELLIQAVPVITAIEVAEENAEENNYQFRVPKVSPRNPENEPTPLELEVLDRLREGDLNEYVVYEENQVRFFRPIYLTPECLLCHGEPAGERDPIGGIREGWDTGEMHGAFEVISSLAPARAAQRTAGITITIITIGIVILVGIFLFIMVRWITLPLTSYIQDYQKASEGDLTVQSNIDSKDEVGRLSSYFNSFINSLNSMIKNIRDLSDDASTVSSDLASTSEETVAALEQMRANAESMKQKIEKLDSEVASSYESSEDVNSFFFDLSDKINSQAEAIDTSSASIEEMSANIQSIAHAAEEKLKIANSLEDTAQNGQTEMQEAVKLINKVAESANVIMDMITVIEDLAAQTNLLAINAAIEAAHAGDAGRGFAVVAGEIRNLATSSSESARKITASLKEISGYIDSSKESSQKSGEMFLSMLGQIKDVASAMQEMTSSTKELSEGSKQILDALSRLVFITDGVKTSSSNMDEKVSKISSSMQTLQNISSDTKFGMQEMSLGIQEIYKASENISNIGIKNMEGVQSLVESVEQFKVKAKHKKQGSEGSENLEEGSELADHDTETSASGDTSFEEY
ncbi:MAG: methyl-accepting chemotaxis protein [Spirochaetia bacterium]